MNAMMNKLSALTVLVVLTMAGAAGYRLIQSQIATQIYRKRLTTLNAQYGRLRDRYNDVVAKTAVTLLVVKGGKLTVVVRDADGTVRRIATPYDPRHAIYVDYVVKDGRLWIRRVFDDHTPPNQGTLIDPALGKMTWKGHKVVGKAVYRSLSPGVWQVTVTGDGSLGLGKCESCDARALVSEPPVRSFKPLKQTGDRAPIRIGPGQVFKHLLGD